MLHMRGICYTPGEYVTHQEEYVTHEGNMLHMRGICYT